MRNIADIADAGGNADVIDAAGYGESSTAGVAYALNDRFWYPDLSKRNLDRLMQRIKNEAKTSNNIITDKTKWTFANFSGLDVFAIYSTEKIEEPTLPYESKGKQAEFEKEYLLNLLEEKENAQSVNRESILAGKVFVRNRVQSGNGVQGVDGYVGRGRNNRHAGVLPRQSRRKPSPAFRNVVENIFEVQRDIDDVFAPPRHKAKEPSKGMALLLGAEGEGYFA